MATEEQKNNQQTLNDLLKDYINGQAEAAEYTALVTSRTADLTDAIRRTVRQKQVSTELDKQLVSSVKKLSDLSRALEKPYESVADIQKDIIKNDKERIKLENTIGALRSKLSKAETDALEAYLKQQDKVIEKEQELQKLRSSATGIEKEAAEGLAQKMDVEKDAEKQFEKAGKELGEGGVSSYKEKVKRIEDIKAAEKLANQEVFTSKEILREAETRSETAKLDLDIARQSGTQEEINKATEKLRLAQKEIDIAKQLQIDAEKNVASLNQELSKKENILSKKEEEYKAAKELKDSTSEAVKIHEEELKKRTDINFETVKGIALTEHKLVLERETSIELEKKLGPEAKIIAQAEEAVKISEQNAEFLKEQELRQKEIVKLQGLYNLSLGFAEGLLKKLGASGAAIALGLEEGKKAADEMARAIEAGEEKAGLFGGQLKVLGAGIMGTFKGMAKGIKQALSLAAIGALLGKLGGMLTKAILSPLKGIFGELKGYASSFVGYITNSFLSIRGFVDSFKEGESLIKQLSQATEDLATGLGVSTSEAKQLTSQVSKFSGELGAFPEKLAQNMVELNQAFGTTQKFSDETARSFNRMVERLGFSTKESAEFVKLSKLNGEEVDTTLRGIEDQTMALKNQYGVAISQKSIYQEISKASEATRLTLGNNVEELTNAAFQAKRLGLEMNKVSSMGDSLLEFESSIAKEMEAELLIGRDLNLERARQAALQGDIATVAEEIAGQIGSAAEFGEMNVLQQQALADSVGVSRDELAKMLTTQEMLANTGFDDMNQAQQEFNKLVESGMSIEEAQAKFRQKYGDEALAAQAAQVSYAKQKEQQERRVLAAQAAMADAMMPVAEAMKRFHERLQAVRKVLINQMRPFFKELGGLIDDGGDSFQKILKEYVVPLGKRLNDIGLTLVRFARENGPSIKKIFVGVLDVFSSIYDFIGRIITRLFDVQTEAGGAKGVFQSIIDTLSKAANYIANINVDKLINKVSDFAGKIKDTFQLIGEKISHFVDLLKSSPGLSTAGVGALALTRVAPRTTASLTSGAVKTAGRLAGNAGNVVTQKLGFGKVFGALGSSASKPLYVTIVGDGGIADSLGKTLSSGLGRKAGIGGGFRSGASGMLSYAKDAFKGGRAGVVGRARLARAAKGLVTGKGVSFVGGTRTAASTASKLASGASGIGKAASSAGKLAAGGGLAASAGIAIVGVAAEMALDHFAGKAKAAAGALDEQIAMTTDMGEAAELEQKRNAKLETARNLGIAAETAKFAGYGAAIGTMIGGPFGAAIGGGVGALVGFTKGVIDAEKARKREESAAGKFAREMELAAIKQQKSLAKIEVQSALMRAKSAVQAAEAEKLARENFAKELAGANATFKDLQSMDIKHTDEAFKKLATQAYNAGNITEEEFANALKGSLDPLEVLSLAAQRSGERINDLTEAAISAADAVGNTLRKQMLEAAGVNEDVVNARLNAIQAISDTAEIGASDLFGKFKGDLTKGVFDSEAVESLRGEDSQSAAFMAELTKEFKKAGVSDKQLQLAQELYANKLEAAGEDFDIDEIGDVVKLQQGIAESLQTVVKSDVLKTEATVESTRAQVLTQIDDSGIIKQLASLSKEQISGDETLQGLLSTIGVDMAAIATDGISGNEQKAIQEKLITAVTEGLAGIEGGNANLLADLQTTLSGDEIARAELTKAITEGTYLKSADESAAGGKATIQADVEISPESKKGFSEKIADASGALLTFFDPLITAGKFFIDGFISYFTETFGAFKTYFTDIFGGAFDLITNLFTGNFSDAWGNIKTMLFALPKLLGTLIKNGVKRMWNGFLGFIKLAVTVGPKIYDAIKKAAGKIKDTLISTFKKVTEKVKQFFQDPIGTIKSGFEAAVNFIKEKFFSIKDAIFEKFQSVGEWIKGVISGALSDLGAALGIDDLGGKLKAGFEGIIGTAKEKFGAFKTTIFDIFKGVGETIMGVIKSPINTMVGLINSMIENINSALTFEIPAIEVGGYNISDPILISVAIPTIPMIQDGTALPPKGPFTITDKFGATTVTAKGDGVVVSPNITHVNDAVTNNIQSQIFKAQTVQDGASISHNGPFTIQDSKGNVAITHPKDKLVVSPNVSYVADGTTGKGGPVFPVSEKFGALDVKVGKEGVLVQKVKDGVMASNNISETTINHINTTQQVNDGIGFWEVMTDPIGAIKHYVLPVLVEESGHIIKSLFKTKALSTALKGILKKTPIIGHAMHAATGVLNISHLLHEEGMSERQLSQEIGKAALVTLGGIGGGLIGTAIAGSIGSISGPGAIVIGALGGMAGSMIGEIFAEYIADTLGAEPVGKHIVAMFKDEEASQPSFVPHITENVAPKLESQFNLPQKVSDALGGVTQYVQDAVAGDLVWSDTNKDGLGDTIQKVMKSGQHVAVTSKQVYDHLKEFDVLGLKSTDYNAPLDQTYSGFLTIIKSYINEAVKGDENALDIIMNPFKDASYETALKDYQPVSPTKNTLFYPAKVSDSGPNYKTPQSLIQQTEIAQVKSPEQVEDGIGFWEVMSNPIGALKHYAVPAVVEGSGHLIEALYKTKVFSSLFKKALHKTPIVGQAMHAVTGALNISHLLHDEKLSKDEIYQEVGKTALITMGGIAGGILGEVAMGALGLATGPGAIVLGMLGGMAGAMLGEIVAEAVADLIGARPVGKMIAGFMDLGHSDTHPTSEPTPNLAMVTPVSNTIQKVADGGALASRGPFTITDKFGATAITAKGDGVVVSPNISYVNDGIVDVEPMNQIATSSTQQHTTVIEQDNSELKKELEGMKQLMSELIKELPTIANRPIRVELDGNKVGESLGRITYRG